MKIIGVIFLVFVFTVATHDGEFWPFSIFPMFSKAGNPWTRAMVLDVTNLENEELWKIHSLNERSAAAISLRKQGVDQIDFSNFVSKTNHWSETRTNALLTMFDNEVPQERQWMIAKVRGELDQEDLITVQIHPLFLLSNDRIIRNPLLDDSHYFLREE